MDYSMKPYIKKAKHQNGMVFWLVFWSAPNGELMYYASTAYKHAKNRLVTVRADAPMYGNAWNTNRLLWTIL